MSNIEIQMRPQQFQDSPTQSGYPSNNNETRIFVHGLHPFTSSKDLTEAFKPFCTITDLVFKKNPVTGKHRGYAFFTVPSESAAQNLINSEHVIHGRRVHCDLRHSCQATQLKNQKKRVFIGGIPKNVSDNNLTEFFARFGKVRAAYAIKSLSGERKNYGYVDFFSEKSAQDAVKNSPVFIKNRKVDIRPYKKRGKNKGTKQVDEKQYRGRELNNNNSFSSSSTRPNSSDRSNQNQTLSQFSFSPVQDRFESKIDYELASPDLQNNVLGCFMNTKGEQLQRLTKLCMAAMMNNDQKTAHEYLERIQVLKREIFNGQYMGELKGLGLCLL